MSREKQIEEMAHALCGQEHSCGECDSDYRCEFILECSVLHRAGYRKQSEWISVEERLPDNNTERVLVFLVDDDFTKPIGENKIDTDRFVDGKWVRWSRFVTHWMPLPEPPKGD